MRLLNLMLDLEDEEIEDKLHMLQGAVLLLEELEPRPRRWWVRPWMLSPQKSRKGAFSLLMDELRVQDVESFHNFVRVPPAMFNEILTRLEGRIQVGRTNFRKSHPPGLRLAITMRFLASGEMFISMHYSWRVGRSTITKIVRQVVRAIIQEYAAEVIRFPRTAAEWKAVADRLASCGSFGTLLVHWMGSMWPYSNLQGRAVSTSITRSTFPSFSSDLSMPNTSSCG